MRFLILALVLACCRSVKIDVGAISAIGSYSLKLPIFSNQYMTHNLILNSDSTYKLNKYAPPIPIVSEGSWRIKDSVLILTPFDEYYPDAERDSSYFDNFKKIEYTKVNPDSSVDIIRIPRINNSMYVINLKEYGDFIFKTDSICYCNGVYKRGCLIKEKN